MGGATTGSSPVSGAQAPMVACSGGFPACRRTDPRRPTGGSPCLHLICCRPPGLGADRRVQARSPRARVKSTCTSWIRRFGNLAGRLQARKPACRRGLAGADGSSAAAGPTSPATASTERKGSAPEPAPGGVDASTGANHRNLRASPTHLTGWKGRLLPRCCHVIARCGRARRRDLRRSPAPFARVAGTSLQPARLRASRVRGARSRRGRRVRMLDQVGEAVTDVGAEVYGLAGELVGQLGPPVGEDDDVVDIEAAEEIAVAAAFPGGELRGEGSAAGTRRGSACLMEAGGPRRSRGRAGTRGLRSRGSPRRSASCRARAQNRRGASGR
jgi:hypothetical protein